MARLGKSKSGVSTIVIAAAVIALVAGAAYFLFAPGEPAPQADATATQTALPEGTPGNVVADTAGGGSSTPVPDGTGTPGGKDGLSTTEGGAALTPDPLQTPLAEATIIPNPSPTADSGAISNGATPRPTEIRPTGSKTAAPTPNADSTVTNSAPTSQPTGEVPVAEITPLPSVRQTPRP